MEVFPFSPVGDVKITYDWGCKETSFADGSKQYVRKRVHAKKSYDFSIGGAEDYAASMKRLLAFFDAHRGIEDTFLFRYDKHTEVVRFGAAIVPKCYRENGRIVTFTCAITLDVAQAADDYGTMGADDTLPVPLGETEETFDWQTGTVTLGVKSDYYQKRTKPARKIAAHFDEPSFSDGTFNCKLTSRLPEVDCPNRSYRLACNCAFGDGTTFYVLPGAYEKGVSSISARYSFYFKSHIHSMEFVG